MHSAIKLALAWLAAGLAAGSTAGHAEEFQALQPASQWAIDENPNSCGIQRWFGGAGKEVLADIRLFEPSSRFRVTLASANAGTFKPPSGKSPQDGKLRVQFGNEPFRTWSPTRGQLGNGMDSVEFTADVFRDGEEETLAIGPVQAFEQVRDQREEQASSIRIANAFADPLELTTGNLHPALTFLRECTQRMIKGWGLDPQVQAHLSRHPKFANQAVIAERIQREYPAKALAQRVGTILRVRTVVGADGKPTACNVQVPNPIAEFNEIACGIVMRGARFEPALDDGGKAVPGYHILTIVYSLVI